MESLQGFIKALSVQGPHGLHGESLSQNTRQKGSWACKWSDIRAFCTLIITQMETLPHLGTHNIHHGVKETLTLGLTKPSEGFLREMVPGFSLENIVIR